MIRLTRHGWREMLIGTLLLVAVGAVLFIWIHPLALLVLPVLVWLFAFFRDPERKISDDPRAMVSPADGTVSDITEIEHDPLIGGPAVRVGIFLSVFNVHVNRSPCDGRVASVTYKRGKFVNAMRHGQASEENESNTIVLNDPNGEQAVAVVKQIVGLIARRIVCTVKPGDKLSRGERIGMIKFGSRTELTIPQRLSPKIVVQIGQKVRGAGEVIAMLGMPIGTAKSDSDSLREVPA
jgi:phosphatidylserine decarboxylase